MSVATFWTIAAALAVLAAGFVLWPLRRRGVDAGGASRRHENVAAYKTALADLDAARAAGTLPEADYQAARMELDRRLLAEADELPAGASASAGGRGLLLAVAVLVPVLALGFYQATGALGAVELDRLLARLDQAADDAERAALSERALPLLEAQARGKDAEGSYRFMLARAYMDQQRYPEAAALFSEVAEIYPQDAAILAQAAQALYLAGGSVTPAVQGLIDRALAIDPAQRTVLGMIGMDRFRAGDFAGAVEAWEKLVAQLPQDSPDAAMIRDGIALARSRLGGDAAAVPAHGVAAADAAPDASAPAPAPAEPAAAPAATPDGAGPRIEVSVSLASGMQPPDGATVFVFARAVSGPPMPLAVARFPVSELPKTVRLDDSMAMAPGMKLSSFPEVQVTARVSTSGSAMPQPGDLEGGSGPLRLEGGSHAIDVSIDRRI